jgi:hypothetical protein
VLRQDVEDVAAAIGAAHGVAGGVVAVSVETRIPVIYFRPHRDNPHVGERAQLLKVWCH